MYDSLRPLRKTSKGNNNKNLDHVAKSSTAGEYLRLLQTFLVRFCFFNNDNVLRKLKSDPTYILKNAVHEDSPQQTNVWDCGLFSLGVALHLVNGIDIDRDIFSPDHISTFRTVLYEEFENRMTTTTGRRRASSSGGVRLRGFDGRFIYSFFPRLESLSHPLRLVSATTGAGTTTQPIPEAVEGAHVEKAVNEAVEEPPVLEEAGVDDDADDANTTDFNVVGDEDEDDAADNGDSAKEDKEEEPVDRKVAPAALEEGCPDHYFLSIFMPPLIDTEAVDCMAIG